MQNWQHFRSAALTKPKTTTTDDIRVFLFDGRGLRCIEIGGRRMFAPVDVYRCIGAADPHASAKYFLRGAESEPAENWPYPGRKPRVVDTQGVLDLLDSVRESNPTALAFRQWFQSDVMADAGPAEDTPITGVRMADISDKLDPDVQASLRDAFRAVQEVSRRLSTALEKRAALMDALAGER